MRRWVSHTRPHSPHRGLALEPLRKDELDFSRKIIREHPPKERWTFGLPGGTNRIAYFTITGKKIIFSQDIKIMRNKIARTLRLCKRRDRGNSVNNAVLKDLCRRAEREDVWDPLAPVLGNWRVCLDVC